MKTMLGLLLASVLSTAAAANTADDATTIKAYQSVVLNGPRHLVEELSAGQVAAAKKTLTSIYFAWEVIDPQSGLYTESLATAVCADGMRWSCQGIIESKADIDQLYSDFALNQTLSLAEVKQLANRILANGGLE